MSRLKAASWAVRVLASRTTSLAEVYRPDSTLAATNLFSAGFSETFTAETSFLSILRQ
jgi:hypothetical protein